MSFNEIIEKHFTERAEARAITLSLLRFWFFALVLFIFVLPKFQNLHLSIFQERDMNRAQQVLHGNLVPFGPETTGGGYLPGPFYYFLIAIPLALGFKLKGVWLFFNAISSLCLSSLLCFAQKRLGSISGLLVLVVLSTSEIILGNRVELFNSSWLIPLVALGLPLLIKSFDESNPRRGRAWLLYCLLTSLGIQLQLTAITLLLSGIAIQLMAPNFSLPRLRARNFICGLFIFVIPLLPFCFWLLKGAMYNSAHGIEYGGTPINSFAVIWYELGFLSKAFFPFPILVSDYLALAVLCIFTSLFFWTRHRRALPRNLNLEQALSHDFRIILFFGAMSIIPALPAFFIPIFKDRYAICFVFAFSYCLGLIHAKLTLRLKVGKLFQQVSLLAIALTMFWRVLPNQRLSPPGYFLGVCAVGEVEYERILRVIYNETGWDVEAVRKNLFGVGLWNEVSISRWVSIESTAPRPHIIFEPDGYFLVCRPPTSSNSKASDLGLDRRLPTLLRKGLTSGAIEPGKSNVISDILELIPYRVLDTEHYPQHFQNFGDPYGHNQQLEIEALRERPQVSKKSSAVAIFNQCGKSFCDYAFKAEASDLSDPTAAVHVRLIGEALAQPAAFDAPEWSQVILQPYIEFVCVDKSIHRVEIVDSIGFDVGSAGSNRTFLTPVERSVHSGCKGPVSEIKLGFASSVAIINMSFAKSLPGEARTFPLR